ncbi:MAG: hypothetical protein IPO27_09660 [Bacteroidetes bacterium]|nr:hypothetical protein [Bacteroidota bacterium]
MDGMTAAEIKDLKDPSYNNIILNALSRSDAFVNASDDMPKEFAAYIKKSGKPVLKHTEENYVDAYNEFYESMIEEEMPV